MVPAPMTLSGPCRRWNHGKGQRPEQLVTSVGTPEVAEHSQARRQLGRRPGVAGPTFF
jgi:hypothetical protein